MLFKNIKKYKKKIALLSNDPEKKITFEQIQKEYQKLKKKVKERKLVLLIADNNIGNLLHYIILLKNNCIVQLVEAKTNFNEIQNLIKLYKPNLICSDNNWFKKNQKKYYKKKIFQSFNSTIYETSFKNHKIHKDLSILMPTSGSMGSKKYVRISKKNIFENTKSIISYLKLNKKDRSITSMPFCYSYMLSVINSHIEIGASIFVTSETIVQKNFWSILNINKITNFNGVPYHYEILLKFKLNKIFNKNIKFLTQAGGKLDSTKSKLIIKFCKKNNINFFKMYGQTEASPRMSFIKITNYLDKIDSIGKAIPGGRLELIDKNNKKITKSNKIGELIYKGKNVCIGYAFNYKDLLKDDQNKNILKTGDLGFFDKKNFYYLVGRKSRIIKIYGNRFNLDDIEERLLKKNIKIACKNSNNKLIVYSEKKHSEKKLIKNIYKVIPLSKISMNFKFLDKIPRLRNGKIDYKSLDFND